MYREWGELLPDWVDVLPLVPPGRETRIDEPPRRDLDALVAGAAGAMSPYLDRPFGLFGHSLGAIVAYHVAHLLREQGLPEPAHLFVAGHRAPHLPDRIPPIHHLPDEAFADGVRELGGMPEDVLAEPELMRLLLPGLRADFTISDTYTYRPLMPLDCPVTALGGLADHTATEAETEEWRVHTTGAFRHFMLPGGHFFLSSARQLLTGIVESGIHRSLRSRVR
ncbi:thioesterase [Streptomyces sp. MST-110588]|nr:thioesterase [Streptomyces sp. MST-110588]